MPRHNVDSKHGEIRDELRRHGYQAFDTSRLGEGFPDLVVVAPDGRVALLFEVKTAENVRAGKIEEEVKFMLKLVNPVYRWVFTAEQALAIMSQGAELRYIVDGDSTTVSGIVGCVPPSAGCA